MALGIKEYLESLPEAVLTRLFKSPATCLAIFRLLPPLAKTILLEMVFTNEPMPLARLEALVKPSYQRLQLDALQKLRQLRIVKERYAAKSIVANTVFCDSLKCALTSGAPNNQFGVPFPTSKDTPQKLALYAKEKWECILHFMVGNGLENSDVKRPSPRVLLQLQQSGLMAGASLERLHITSQGFQFLLQDLNTQVWSLLLYYLGMASSVSMDEVEVLNFVFMLGSLELGKDYGIKGMSDTQLKMMEDLSEIGIVKHLPKSDRFSPTPLASILTSGADPVELDSTRPQKGFIILETNYRMYAYTDSPLQICILDLFCQLKSRFSNLVVGRITRESIRKAFSNGITADQIIQYLADHAHEQMRDTKKGTILPPTVSDQIKLWQLEMDRFRATNGYLYKGFTSPQEYNLVASYAEELGALLWKNDAKRIFFVDRDSNQQVVEYINRKMQ